MIGLYFFKDTFRLHFVFCFYYFWFDQFQWCLFSIVVCVHEDVWILVAFLFHLLYFLFIPMAISLSDMMNF